MQLPSHKLHNWTVTMTSIFLSFPGVDEADKWTKRPKTTCSASNYGEYNSLSAAKTACYNRGVSCSGVRHSDCRGSVYYLCRTGSIASYSSTASCVYASPSALHTHSYVSMILKRLCYYWSHNDNMCCNDPTNAQTHSRGLMYKLT